MEEHLTPAEQAERALNPKKPLFIRLLQWRYVIPFTIIFLLIAAPLVYRNYVLNEVPDIGDPFDVEAFGTVDLPDAENARIEYEQAVALKVALPTIPGRYFEEEESLALEEGWHYASPPIRQWLDDNRPALQRWKLGTEKPDFLYHQPRDMVYHTSLDLVQEMRDFTRLAQLEASRLLVEGNPRDAWIWTRAIFRCSRHLGRHGSMIERMVGIALHAVSVESVLDIAEHPATDVDLLQQMLAELTEGYAHTTANSSFVKVEYLMVINAFGPHEMKELRASDSFSPVIKGHIFIGVEPYLSRLIVQQYFANILGQIDLPLPQRQECTGSFNVFRRDPATTYSQDALLPEELNMQLLRMSLARFFMPAMSAGDVACLREESRQHAVELCLALRIFDLKHGHYPASADELTIEGILTKIPVDPFSRKGDAMRYRINDREAFVYSVGENGIDDGGTEVDSENGKRSNLDVGIILGRSKDDSVAAKKP